VSRSEALGDVALVELVAGQVAAFDVDTEALEGDIARAGGGDDVVWEVVSGIIGIVSGCVSSLMRISGRSQHEYSGRSKVCVLSERELSVSTCVMTEMPRPAESSRRTRDCPKRHSTGIESITAPREGSAGHFGHHTSYNVDTLTIEGQVNSAVAVLKVSGWLTIYVTWAG
jgi:hypothetical protein